MSDSFASRYKSLNDAQKEAVDTIEGALLVVAGPGTGKTELLSIRVANILRNSDTDAGNILCLTFTNKAATNMRDRLFHLIGPVSRQVVVRTFHSFAAEIMNQYPDYFWSGARLSVAPDAVQDDIIQSILVELPLDSPLASTFAGTYTALNDIKNALKLAKEAGLTPDELSEVIKQNLDYIEKIEPKLVNKLNNTLSNKKLDELLSSVEKLPPQKLELSSWLLPLDQVIINSLKLSIEEDKDTGKTKQTGKWKQRWIQSVQGKKGMHKERKRNQWWLEVADLYAKYREKLHERGYYDYADMLVEVLEQLKSMPDMLADIQEKFQYVLIDEFQDTNAAQLRLAQLISDHYVANGNPNIMAVGDDDQSIFAFNGAELNNVLEFQRHYPESKTIVLKENYRSRQKILDVAEVIIELAEDRLTKRIPEITKKLSSNVSGDKARILHKQYPTREVQFTETAREIKELWMSGHRDIAVLARKHESLRQIASILQSLKVPIKYEQQSNVLEHEAVETIITIAQAVVSISTGDKQSVDLLLSRLLRHPMWNISHKKLWKLALLNYSNPDWLETLLDSDDTHLQSIGNWLVWLARYSSDLPLPLLLEYIIGLNNSEYLKSPVRDYYLKKGVSYSEYLETLAAVSILQNMTSEFATRKATLDEFIKFIDLSLRNHRVIANETWFVNNENSVELLTIYKAKGLEFDDVFLVDTVESMWQPRVGGRSSPANLQLQSYGENYDDYVRLLYVAITRARHSFHATSYNYESNGSEVLATPLLASIEQISISDLSTEPVEVLEENLRWPTLSTDDEKVLLSERLSNFVLSPTAFIDFLNIAESGPRVFKERHLIHLPVPHSPEGSYGTAIHASMETAQRLVNTSKLDIKPVLDRFEQTLKEQHLHPTVYEQFKARGCQLLENLIHNQTFLKKDGLSEQYIGDIVLDKARIKGKLDRIDSHKTHVLVSDYKTGKPLSSFDTKDQTKMIKAWRHRTQLLFYILLVNESKKFHAKAHAQMIYLESEGANRQFLKLLPEEHDLKRLTKLIEIVWEHIQTFNFPDVGMYSPDSMGINQFEQDLLDKKI